MIMCYCKFIDCSMLISPWCRKAIDRENAWKLQTGREGKSYFFSVLLNLDMWLLTLFKVIYLIGLFLRMRLVDVRGHSPLSFGGLPPFLSLLFPCWVSNLAPTFLTLSHRFPTLPDFAKSSSVFISASRVITPVTFPPPAHLLDYTYLTNYNF